MQVTNTGNALRNYLNKKADKNSGYDTTKTAAEKTDSTSSAPSYAAVAGAKAASSLNSYYKELEASNKTYESAREAAQSMRNTLEKLMAGGEESLFAAAETSGDNTAVIEAVTQFVEQYNSMMTQLSAADDSTNRMMITKFKNTASIQEDALNKIGISINKDGTLAMNSKTLEKADLADLKSVFGEGASFAEKALERTKTVEKNAVEVKAKQTSILSSYNKSGLYGDEGSALLELLGSYFSSYR